MTPDEQLRLEFKHASKHVVLRVRPEGEAEGTGPLAGAQVVEDGMHDTVPGPAGNRPGDLVFTRDDGAKADVKWRVRAVSVAGEDGKPKLLDNGYWEIAGATGALESLTDGGTLNIRPASTTDRCFVLEGELPEAAR